MIIFLFYFFLNIRLSIYLLDSNVTNQTDKNDSLTPSLDFREMFELMTANQVPAH